MTTEIGSRIDCPHCKGVGNYSHGDDDAEFIDCHVCHGQGTIVQKPCGIPTCSTSTGICESITHGYGKLDDWGYWQFPCAVCARYYESQPDNQWGKHWPFPERKQ